MRTQKEIRADIIKAQKRVWKLNAELRDAEKHYKNTCPHKRTNEREIEDSYFEAGRMTAPAYTRWKEKYCTRCGKILGKKYLEKTEKWEEKWSRP